MAKAISNKVVLLEQLYQIKKFLLKQQVRTRVAGEAGECW
ncbi:22583_t:CDS:2 [Gigaspora margarita]|uniref:22583_t:CDS:1 n=1 Tax=Gigaspora margarita TaxID=4874 RepID=A0ABN7UCN7_GIGMA|nr:22583_t:CDS:2 [Gigaspora margarita]